MKINDIEISGIITQEELSNYNLQYPRKEISETFGIDFSEEMATIDIPLQVFFDAKVVESKSISTQGQNKVFIHGIITTKFVYVADETTKPIKTVEFYKHFSCFFPIGDGKSEEINTRVFIEDAIITQNSNRGFYISLLLLACPVYSRDVDKHKDIEILPKREKLNKVEEPKNISKAVRNKDVDVEIEYDMNMTGQYFESDWK